MASKVSQNQQRVRYEYRVWGEHRKARKLMAKLGSVELRESVEDCYLLIDDSTYNAKVRNNTLKIKELVAEDDGFEGWSSGRYRDADSAPEPFDTLFEELNLDRPQQGKKYSLARAVDELDPELGVTAVFVIKTRRLYRIGDLKAEVTDIDLGDGDSLRTLAIEGRDLDDLSKLRKRLGLAGEDNVAVHQVIEEALAS